MKPYFRGVYRELASGACAGASDDKIARLGRGHSSDGLLGWRCVSNSPAALSDLSPNHPSSRGCWLGVFSRCIQESSAPDGLLEWAGCDQTLPPLSWRVGGRACLDLSPYGLPFLYNK